jgi:hypothetical protein
MRRGRRHGRTAHCADVPVELARSAAVTARWGSPGERQPAVLESDSVLLVVVLWSLLGSLAIGVLIGLVAR